MPRLRKRILTVAAVAAFAASGIFQHALGQSIRPPHVYNPQPYYNNRALMNNRAAARAALKRRHKAKAKAKRRRARRASAGRL
ncbi:MAG TPA: hypothetical protein VM914_08735 [Pyrinomonadaceae bacterium]|jgi:hypothetical protein|nr:hypothetical protein [Pyrinomonadaceae bacterium]